MRSVDTALPQTRPLLTAVSAVCLSALHILSRAGAMWPAGVEPDATSSGCSMNCSMNWKGV